MKTFNWIVKKTCIGVFSLYSLNILFSTIGISVPINLFTIPISSFLGVFGLIGVIFLKVFI